MYYELYVDVLFLVNFMMDYILLLLVKRMLSCSATQGNICIGAVIGAGLTCVIVVLPIPHPLIKVVLFHSLVNTCMILVGLKIKTMRSFLKALILLYIGGFLLGGILEFFYQYVRMGSLFFALAIAGYYIALGIWKFISYLQRWNQCHCQVELFLGEKQCKVKGMIDTGNTLRDPMTDRPVSIIDRSTAEQYFGEETRKNILYIPYCSIGKKSGILPVFEIDKMCVYRDSKIWVKQPLIGISEGEVSAGGDYEMILNPNLF